LSISVSSFAVAISLGVRETLEENLFERFVVVVEPVPGDRGHSRYTGLDQAKGVGALPSLPGSRHGVWPIQLQAVFGRFPAGLRLLQKFYIKVVPEEKYSVNLWENEKIARNARVVWVFSSALTCQGLAEKTFALEASDVMRKKIRLGLVELYATQDGGLWSPRMKDLYSIVRLPSRAVDLLAAIADRTGLAEVTTFNPLYDSRGGRFRREDLERLAALDVVGISAITRTQPPSYELARLLKERNPSIRILFGGPHVTALPDEALEHGDVVVRHEGDATIAELLERLAEHAEDPVLGDVLGISFREKDGSVRHNPDRPFLTNEELNALPFPVYSKEVVRGISNSVIVSSRGCPFACDFCAVITQFGSRYRFLDVDRSVELIEHTLRQTRKPIFFGDDNFCGNPARTKAILERILSKGIPMPSWGAQVRVEASQDAECLALMKRAGCTRLYVGFESINEDTLKLFNKHSTLEKNELAIRRFHEAGFSVHGMFVLGSDADTVETVRETVRFAKDLMVDTAQFFSLTPIPGTPLSARYAEQGKILSRSWHLYDAHHVTVVPEKIAPHVLQQELARAHLEFYSWKEAVRHLLLSSDRFYNAKIRILGNLLARRILGEMRPYEERLGVLDGWSREMEARFQRLRKQLASRVEELGSGLSQGTAAVKESAEEFVRWLRASADTLPKEFLSYCQKLASASADQVRGVLPCVQGLGAAYEKES